MKISTTTVTFHLQLGDFKTTSLNSKYTPHIFGGREFKEDKDKEFNYQGLLGHGPTSSWREREREGGVDNKGRRCSGLCCTRPH